MDTKQITARLESKTDSVWQELCLMYPKLVRAKPPTVKLNGRFWRTAGRCFQETGIIELGSKFLLHSAQHRATMYSVILPHEIIHYADFVLFGESEKKCGHGVNWQKIMVQYGLEPNPYHSMDVKR
jgi:predicted SprT family Zn-dependent metalloprotease